MATVDTQAQKLYSRGMTRRSTLNVSLTPELERFVTERVKTGRFASASEVVREGLRLLEEREMMRERLRRELDAKLEVGVDDAHSGRLVDADEVLEDARARVRKLRDGS